MPKKKAPEKAAKTKKSEPTMDVRPNDIWRSGDPRDGSRRIRVVTVTKADIEIETVGSGRRSYAARARFNGKRNGYVLVARDGKPVNA